MLNYGFNTNGFAHHHLEDAVTILSKLGYSGVSITVDVHHLNPWKASSVDLAGIKALVAKAGMAVTIETGARFILDAARKHRPNLLEDKEEDRRKRIDFLKDCVEIGRGVGGRVISFWAGKLPEGVREANAWERLVAGCKELVDFARGKEMVMAFEPEPGMLVEGIAGFRKLREEVGKDLKLALDVGHCYCTKDLPVSDVLAEFKEDIAVAALEDIRNGKHEHLMFGEGEIDFKEVLGAFKAIDYKGLLSVELSRDSHRAPEVAERSIRFLRGIEKQL